MPRRRPIRSEVSEGITAPRLDSRQRRNLRREQVRIRREQQKRDAPLMRRYKTSDPQIARNLAALDRPSVRRALRRERLLIEAEQRRVAEEEPAFESMEEARAQLETLEDRRRKSAIQNRKALGLAAALTPVGRGGSVAARLARYALRRPGRALIGGTAAAHAAGKLDIPKPKPGEERAGIDIPGVKLPGGKWTGRAGKAALDIGLYSGPAVYEAGKAVTQDVAATRAGKDFSFKRTRKLEREVRASVKHGVTHPTEPESFVQNLLLGLGGLNVAAHVVERGRGAISAPSVRKAVTRKGSEGGSVLHTRRAGVKGGRGQGDSTLRGPGGIKAQRLEPDAPILRPGHHARTAWLNWRLAHPDAPLNRWAVGRAENVLARERGSAERVLTAADRNRIAFLRQEGRKLDQTEHTASRLVYTEGRDPGGGWLAFARPDEVVKRHVATERAYARRARQRGDREGAAMHLMEAKAIEASLPILKAPSKKFRTALAGGRRESRRGEQADIERGHLTVAQAETRKAGLAFLHGRGAPPSAVTGETRDAFLARTARSDRVLAREAARLTARRARAEQKPAILAHYNDRLGEIAAKRAQLAEETATARDLRVPGATFFSTAEHFKLPMRSTQPRAAQTGRGLSIGPPAKSRYRFGSMRRFTGSGIERTGQVQRPITGIAELQAGRTIAHAQEDLYHELWQAATPRKSNEYQVAIRSARTNPLDLRRLDRAQKAADAGDETPLGEFIRSRYDDLVVPEAESQLVATGERLPGVRWIDKALVKRLEPTGNAQSGLAKFARAINRPARFFGVYARPGYIATNRPGNEAMGVFLHGPKAFSVGTRGRLKRSLGQEGLAMAEGAAGTTRTESYRMADLVRRRYAHAHPAGRALGQTGDIAAWLENFIVRHVTNTTDRSFRLRMFEIRAAQRGYHGAASVRYLLKSRDPAVRADLAAAGRRARKDAVDFDSLTARERPWAELFYFYPWTSRAFVWTGRSLVNRPLTAGTIAAAAPVARERQPDWLFETPDYLRGAIATKAGNVFNLGAVSTPATPAQTIRSAIKVGQGAIKRKPLRTASAIGEFGTPIFSLAAGDPLQEIFGTSGIPALLGLGRKPKAFPANDLETRAKRFGFGSLYPRQPDREYLRERWLAGLPFEERTREKASELAPDERAPFIERETRMHERKDWSPGRKAMYGVYDERGIVYSEARRLGLVTTEDGRLPEKLRRAYTTEAKRKALYAKASAGVESGTRAYQAARFEADVVFLRSFDAIDEAQAAKARAKAVSADRAQLKAYRDYIRRTFYAPGFMDTIAEAKRYLREAGAKGLD